jgi:muramoyltetrapeptide carboxypeptidase
MKRAQFISSLVTTGLLNSSTLVAGAKERKHPLRKWHIPPTLQKGDAIGITCPSGFAMPEDVAPAIQYLQNWGLQVVTGKTVGLKDHTFGGTDEERAADFQEMINRKDIKAILCARGGYGAVRIIDQLDFIPLKKYPFASD